MGDQRIPDELMFRQIGDKCTQIAFAATAEQMTNQQAEIDALRVSVGELRIQLTGVWRRVTALEGRVRNLESAPTMTGSIQGLEGEFTVSTPPEFGA